MTARDKAIAIGVSIALTIMGLATILEPFYDRPPSHLEEK